MFAGKLYKAVYSNQNLNEAWNKVRVNKGTCGIDDMDIVRFNKMVFANLLNLKERLKKKKYQPQPIRRFNMKKADGTKRPIGILTLEDRIVQRAVLQVIEPLFDRHFSSSSFGYRKGLSPQQAIEQVKRHFNRNLQWVVDADLLEFFQSISHRILMKQVRRVITDRDILKLLEKWLDLGVMGFGRQGIIERNSPKVGILQGAPLSPLLANIYLDPFDKALLKKGQKLTRFGDDFIIQCVSQKEAESALAYVNRILQKLKLQLHPHKTNITHFDKGIRFLGNLLRSYHGPSGKTLQVFSLKPNDKREALNHVRALPDPAWGHPENQGRAVPGYPGQEKDPRNAGHQS